MPEQTPYDPAHNPKVAGSNPAPAIWKSPANAGLFFWSRVRIPTLATTSWLRYLASLRRHPVGDSPTLPEAVLDRDHERLSALRGFPDGLAVVLLS
jgi:hypothetical protein